MQESAIGLGLKRAERIASIQEIQLIELFLGNPRVWFYGYQIEDKTDIPSGTLYPLLRKLHKKGWLDKDSDIFEGRTRHYYSLNQEGGVSAQERIDLARIERGHKNDSRNKWASNST